MSAHADLPTFGLDIRPLAGRIGGEVRGLRLSDELTDEVFGRVRQALLHYKVLFFRGQSHLDDAAHQRVGDRFGRTVAHPTVPAPAGTRIFELDASRGGGRADSWHTDVTFAEAFPKYGILRAVTVPAYGGDTIWANTAAAYAHLPESLQRLADGLWAVHSNDYDYGASRTGISDVRLKHHNEVFKATVYETEHPLVHVHPESGERALLLGHFVRRIVGLPTTESSRLFEIFQQRVIRPENTVRWSWQKDDVAIWDNRATQHFAINDYGDQPRLVRRVTVEGEPAVGIDGRRSVARRGPGVDAPSQAPAAVPVAA
ncbi:TauD/TfdA dioxygenase family protein [Orrella dioscoreae]|uniref:Alpha-ketoglutarate-dependent taurine dioxygenase n=1 Tax=Orrella dioscoreae TaxID=1851544 RepID=A0A1C3K657_9BURK|nr:TauD/TfdA family dioxygenase [Orrella dioscoreae]SBT26934.1 Alpha-ketoglutarate-dependent taurine dioxygenase [Orrella dioscoreae]SOE52547.1 Alpha-ketoglutarate-dependent taurine dioxygenase [Orrella dioscoreae]